MRRPEAGEVALLQSRAYESFARVRSMTAAGAWVELTNLVGVNWVDALRLRWDLDAAVASCSLRLRRDATVGGVTYSLAPDVAGSSLNREVPGVGGGAYAPLVDLARRVQVATAVRPLGWEKANGGKPAWADMRVVFDGIVQDQDPAALSFPVECVDLMGLIAADAMAEPLVLGGTPGSPASAARAVLQALLDALPPEALAMLPPAFATVYEPVLFAFAVREYTQDPVMRLDAMRNVALSGGGDVRGRWADSFGADPALFPREFRPTLLRPERDKTVADYTLAALELAQNGVTAYATSRRTIRNRARLGYPDRATDTTAYVTREHAGSLAAYGPIFMSVLLDAAKLLDTPEEAVRWLDDVLHDLALPKATHGVTLERYHPLLEVGDLVQMPPGVVYDAPQLVGITSVESAFEANGTASTAIGGRGTIAGAHREWLEREGQGVRAYVPPPVPILGPIYYEADAFGGPGVGPGYAMAWLPFGFEPGTDAIDCWAEEAESGDFAPPPDVLDANNLAKTITRLPGRIMSAVRWGSIAGFCVTPGKPYTIVTRARRNTAAGAVYGTRRTFYAVGADMPGASRPPALGGISVERRPNANLVTVTLGSAPGATTVLIVRRDGTPMGLIDVSAEAGGAAVELLDDVLDAPDSYTYDAFLWRAGQSGAARAYNIPPTGETPPPETVPPLVPDPVVPPPSLVAAPQFGLHGGVQTPYYGDAVDHDGAGWVRVVWDLPAGAYGVALEKTADPASGGQQEVTFSTLAHYDNRVAGAYESGYYRLVAKSPTFGYLAVSPWVPYRAPTDATGVTVGSGTSVGGGGQTQQKV